MTVATVLGRDATGANSHLIPNGVQAAGYDTGVGSTIPWTAAEYAVHSLPHPAIHIDQDFAASDFTSDVLDVEAGAASDSEIVQWVQNATSAFNKGLRPGQRKPAIYCARSNVNSAVALLQAANLRGVGFWVAQQTTEANATSMVANAIGPYPAIGIQYDFSNPDWDGDVFAVPWLTAVSVTPVPDPPPPVHGTQANWGWCNKCQSLAYGPNNSKSHCPAGGMHNLLASYNYSLPFVNTRPEIH